MTTASVGSRPSWWTTRFVLIVAAVATLLGFLAWKDSCIARDGVRYFAIDDDALISLRYAWNLAHGQGLVWNAGEHVEGITNPLWTLYAAAWATVTSRHLLPMVMQISGIMALLAQCWLLRRIAQHLWRAVPGEFPLWSDVVFLLPLAYYPLVYWSINGLESCAVGAILSLAILCYLEGRCYAAAGMVGVAFWLRPDALLVGGVLFAFAFLDVLKKQFPWRRWLAGVGIVAACMLVLFLLRWAYYGTLWPNTYYLKLLHFHTGDRLRLNALGYLQPFLRENLPLLILAACSLALKPGRRKFLLATPALLMTAYAAYTGGDALPHWRFMAPFIPLLALAAIVDLPRSGVWVKALGLCGLAAVVGVWAWASIPCYREFLEGPAHHERGNIETGITLKSVLKPGATVGVLHAGSVPYYTDFRAIDFLGKCDPIIAHLRPDLDNGIYWGGMHSVPGHNKSNLGYSICELQPTYIETYAWGHDNAGAFVRSNYVYVAVPFETAFTDTYILLLRNSPLVDWEAVRRLDPAVKL